MQRPKGTHVVKFNVRFGSKADMRSAKRDVRYVPTVDICRVTKATSALIYVNARQSLPVLIVEWRDNRKMMEDTWPRNKGYCSVGKRRVHLV
jgi:predicted secreted Zn-dependent protease